MSVLKLGDQWTHNGLELSLAKHVESHEANTKELLNIAGAIEDEKAGLPPRSQFAPLRPYVRKPFPKHVYHPDGRDKVVATPELLGIAKGEGFREDPYPKVRVAVGDPAAEKAALQMKLAESDGKIASQNDLLQKMMARLDAFEKLAAAGDPGETEKRKR